MGKKLNKSLLGIGTGIATGAISMIGQRKREKRAMRNQERLMGIQHGNQRNLNQQAHDLNYEMWEKTNYPGQMKMLKEAGLNAGLLYGMGGQGGSTGGQGGGSASGGNAPAPQPMELGNMLQGAMMQAQIENIKADTKQKEATADSTRGEKGTIGEATINKTNAETVLKNWESKIAEWNELYKEREVSAEVNKLEQELSIVQRENLIQDRTMYDTIERIKNEAVQSAIEIEAKKQGIKLSEQQQNKIWHEIRQGWVKAGLQGLDTIVKGKFKDIGSKK